MNTITLCTHRARIVIWLEKLVLGWNLCFLNGHPWLYMYVCVYICMYIYIRARVGVHMHSCRRILFIRTVQSLLHARVSQVFLNTCMLVWGVIGSGVCFSLFMVSACYWRGRLCFGRGRYKSFVSYISLFFRVLGWWVRVCLYTRVHTHKLLRYLMWAQV